MRRLLAYCRSWLRFRLRTLLAAVAVLCFLLAREVNYYRQQRNACEQLTAGGAGWLMQRHVPKWLFDLSGGQWRYVYGIDVRGSSRPVQHIAPLADTAGIAPGDRLGDIELYYLLTHPLSFGYRGSRVDDLIPVDDLMPVIAQCVDCEVLMFGGARVKDHHLESLRGLSSLGCLWLQDTLVTDEGLQHLAGLKQLRHLIVQGTQVTREGAAKLEAALPGLCVDILQEP